MGNERKGRTGACKPQQTDACSEPDECAGQTDEAKDARDGVGQAEEGQWDAQGQRQATVQLEGPPEGSRGGTEAAEGWRDAARGAAGHNPARIPGTGAQRREDGKERAGPGQDGAGQRRDRMVRRACG